MKEKEGREVKREDGWGLRKEDGGSGVQWGEERGGRDESEEVSRFKIYEKYIKGCRAQLYGRSRQCGCSVGARCSIGLGRNPLKNVLIQHTFKLNILFVEKFIVIHLN